MPEQNIESCRAIAEAKVRSVKVDGHGVVAQSLKSLGVTHVYGVAGTPIRETFAKCAQAGLRPIGVRDQRSGVLMALAQNYVSGRLSGVALFSAGPAITNATTGVLVARDNCWPILVLGGRRPLDMRGIGSFQELDAVSIFQSITKWSALVEKTSEIPNYLQRGIQIALSGRPGPVYLELPEDVLGATNSALDFPLLEPSVAPPLDPATVSRAAEILLRAERPALIVGKGIRWSEPYAELNRLVGEFGIPFITSPMGRGYLPDDHPLSANSARGLLQARADAVLLVGARLDWTFRFGTEISRDAKIIQIDIHAPEIGVNRIPTVGIVGDAKSALQEILAHMSGRPIEPPGHKLALWHAELDSARARRQRESADSTNSTALPMSPRRMFKEIKDFLPRDAICVLDGNVSMAAGQQVLPAYLPVTRFTAGQNGCMGVGVPFAIGAKIAQPDRLVVTVCGDMGFGLSAIDMETAVRHRVPVIFIVANNDGNTGALLEHVYFPASEERISMFQPNIHYETIMNAFGGHGEFIDRPEQIPLALERAVKSGRASCINVKIDPYAPYPKD